MLSPHILKIKKTKLVHLTKEEIQKLEKTTTENKTLYIFGLDDTLYNFTRYVEKKHEKNLADLIHKCKKGPNPFKLIEIYKKKYSIPQIGLLNCCSVEEILNDSTYKTFKRFSLSKNEKLKILLEKIKGDKWIFSNNQLNISEKLLKEMEIFENFEFVFGPDLNHSPVICKPFISAFELLHSLIKHRKYSFVYFFDDEIENIKSGEDSGWECKLCNHKMIYILLESLRE